MSVFVVQNPCESPGFREVAGNISAEVTGSFIVEHV